MTDSVFQYFKAQKRESLYGIGLGSFSVILTIVLLVKGQPYYNGIAYSVIAIGMIQLVTSISVYLKSDMDAVSIDYFIHKEFEVIQEKEIPRMELQMKELTLYLKAAMTCIALGLLLWIFCEPLTLGKGIGFGLAIQASIMLVIDYLAQLRGKVYLDFLKTLIKQQS